jgi:flagellar hook-basal body complex protein FliE
MSISAIGPSIALPQLGTQTGAASGTGIGSSGSSFGSLVRDAVDALDKSQAGAEKEIANAVTGDSTDLHRTIISLQTADLNFQLGLQVRNKLIGAYEEIMKMQV